MTRVLRLKFKCTKCGKSYLGQLEEGEVKPNDTIDSVMREYMNQFEIEHFSASPECKYDPDAVIVGLENANSR